MSEDHCVICGAYVPEGRIICPNCEAWKKSLIDERFCTPLITYGTGYTPPITFGTEITKDTCPMCKRPFKDFVEVVRCKDCKWSNDDCSECMNPTLALGGDYASCLYIEHNWFCADGKRKEKTDGKIC